MYILRIGIGRRGRNEDQEKIKTLPSRSTETSGVRSEGRGARTGYAKILVMKSRKRLAYCSGFTVEISAPAPCLTVLAA